MAEFPGNSKMPTKLTSQAAPGPTADVEKRVEKPVVHEGDVIRKKQPLGKRFAKTFLSGEAPKSVMGHVAQTVIVPMVKDLISRGVQETLQRVLWPNGSSSSSSSYYQNGPVISYNRFSTPGPTARTDQRTTVSHQGRTAMKYDELVFPSRTHAEQVIDAMMPLLEKYKFVTVGDFFDLAGVSAEWTDRDYGWRDLRGIVPIPCQGGFQLNLPRPEHIK